MQYNNTTQNLVFSRFASRNANGKRAGLSPKVRLEAATHAQEAEQTGDWQCRAARPTYARFAVVATRCAPTPAEPIALASGSQFVHNGSRVVVRQ